MIKKIHFGSKEITLIGTGFDNPYCDDIRFEWDNEKNEVINFPCELNVNGKEENLIDFEVAPIFNFYNDKGQIACEPKSCCIDFYMKDIEIYIEE